MRRRGRRSPRSKAYSTEILTAYPKGSDQYRRSGRLVERKSMDLKRTSDSIRASVTGVTRSVTTLAGDSTVYKE